MLAPAMTTVTSLEVRQKPMDPEAWHTVNLQHQAFTELCAARPSALDSELQLWSLSRWCYACYAARCDNTRSRNGTTDMPIEPSLPDRFQKLSRQSALNISKVLPAPLFRGSVAATAPRTIMVFHGQLTTSSISTHVTKIENSFRGQVHTAATSARATFPT